MKVFFFFSSRRRHTRFKCDWSSDVCSSDLIWRCWTADLFSIPGNKSAVQQRQMKLCIVLFDALALVDRPASAADPKSQIPHRARKFGNKRPKLHFGFFVLK